LRRESHSPGIGTPIALETQGGFAAVMFEFEKEKMLTVTSDETAMQEKWILRGRRDPNHRKGRFCL
jgi:hypothetical protein